MTDLYFDKHLEELAKAVEKEFDTEPYVNYFGKMLTVYGVEKKDLEAFVEEKFRNLVYDVGYDHDYGYDEYNDPLTINKNRVVLYCTTLCELDCNKKCNDCGKCIEIME